MNKNLLFICILLTIHFPSLFAQYDIEYLTADKEFGTFKQVTEYLDQIYIVGGENSCQRPALYSQREKTFQAINFPKEVDGIYYFDELEVSPFDDSLLIVSGIRRENDDVTSRGDSTDLPYIALLRGNNVLFDTLLPFPDSRGLFFSEAETNIAFTSDNQVMLSAYYMIYLIEPDGQLVSANKVTDDPILDLERLNDTVMIATTQDSIYWFNNQSVLYNTEATGRKHIDLVADDGLAWLLTDNELISVGTPTQFTIGNLTATNSGISPEGITKHGDHLYIWGSSINSSPFPSIIQVDKINQTILKKIPFEQGFINIEDIHINDAELIVIGQQNTPVFNGIKWKSFQLAFIKSMPRFNTPIFKGDNISLNNFEILGGIITSYQDPGYKLFGNPMVYQYELENRGNDTLTSYSFISENLVDFNCVIFGEFQHITDVNIPPGESITVLDSTFIDLGYVNDPNNAERNLQVAAIGPNYYFEKTQDDNVISILITSVSEIPGLAKFDLFPNPANHQLSVELNIEDQKPNQLQLSVINLQGKVYHQQILDRQFINGLHEISCIDLPVGMYFLQLNTERSTAQSKRFVVSR